MAEVIALAVEDEAVDRNQPETVFGMIGRSAFQQILAFAIRFKTHAPSVFVENIFGTVIDDVFEHLRGSGVERRIRAAPFADGRFHFGNVTDAFVERFHKLQVLFDTGMRHTRGHKQERPLVEARHELLADAGKPAGRCLPESRLPEILPSYGFETLRHKSEERVESQPNGQTEH